MRTECKQATFEFHGLFHRKVKARFDGGKITSDAGVLLLREVEQRTGLVAGLTACFRDHRDPRLIEHTVEELLGQRIYGLCLGYEDLNDHDQLRTDPMLAVAVDKADPLGERPFAPGWVLSPPPGSESSESRGSLISTALCDFGQFSTHIPATSSAGFSAYTGYLPHGFSAYTGYPYK